MYVHSNLYIKKFRNHSSSITRIKGNSYLVPTYPYMTYSFLVLTKVGIRSVRTNKGR